MGKGCMSKSLVIVESPAKAKTINKYLGSEYVVEASLGHIMDLPKNDIGVELRKRTFEPTLIVSPGKEKLVDRLKKLASKADAVFLAPDPDREGEAIAAHLKFQLLPSVKGNTKVQRVTFNEITPKAVKAAFLNAREVDENLVDAQQTRRVLDRLVGYQISPLLWDKVRRGLSAGRVQTVALRLIVEREREINAFNPVEYWTVDAQLLPEKSGQTFTARLIGVEGKPIRVANGQDEAGKDQFLANALPDKEAVEEAIAELEKATWSVRGVERKERKRNPAAPYTTSKLQQDAAGRLGFNVRRTMGVAQRLYEGIEIGNEGTVGLITYMRTDSTRVSPDAVVEVREYIESKLGKEYLPAKENTYKSKKDAQDAHEAIRPTHVEFLPDEIRKYLSDEQYRLYRMIWQRFVESQMMPAIFDQTTVDIAAKASHVYDFRVSGSILKFDGFLKFQETDKRNRAAAKLKAGRDAEAEDSRLAAQASDAGTAKTEDEEADEERRLPNLAQGQTLGLDALDPQQKYTEPPPRFNEASLVKTLEEKGIGRPSTYASIINTIQERDYVKKIGAKLIPTEIGMVVTDLLVKNFPYIFDLQYTARLEGELDAVEEGDEKWQSLLGGFYDHFEKELKVAEKQMEDVKRMEHTTTELCDNCGSPLILKWGKFGSFYACSNFSKAKPMNVALGSLKKDPKATVKKITAAFTFPMTVKAVTDTVTEYAREVNDKVELERELKKAVGHGKKVSVETFSCDFTKENFSAKPDLTSPEAQNAEAEEEFCDNCGRVMVLRNGPWGPFMACPGYNEDPPCKTIRKLTQKVQQKPPVQLEEPCPKCSRPLLLRNGQYGEFISCSGYPKCKYIKQDLLDVKCPKDGGDIAVRKTKRGDTFYGCVNYPKCDFASNHKLVNQVCPDCRNPYILEVSNKEGVFLICPNNHEDMPKRRKKKGSPEEAEEPGGVKCTFIEKIGEPVQGEPELPDPETTRPLASNVA